MSMLSMVLSGPRPIPPEAAKHLRIHTMRDVPEQRAVKTSDAVKRKIIEILEASGETMTQGHLMKLTGKSVSSISMALQELEKDGFVFRAKPSGARAQVFGLPALRKAEHVQPDVPELLREAGDQRPSVQADADSDAGADQKLPGISGPVLGAGSGGELRQALDRVALLEDIIRQYLAARSDKEKCNAYYRLKKSVG